MCGQNNPSRAAYLRSLLDGERNYEIVAEFEQRPDDYMVHPADPGSVRDVLRAVIVPRVAQFGDEQDLGPNQYTVYPQCATPGTVFPTFVRSTAQNTPERFQPMTSVI